MAKEIPQPQQGVGVPARAFSAIALIAVANGALLTMIMASRFAFGMAEHGLLPHVLGRVPPRRRTPLAIASTTVVAMVRCRFSVWLFGAILLAIGGALYLAARVATLSRTAR